MSVMHTIDIIEALDDQGYGEIKARTLKIILVIYELGSLTRPEIRQICRLTEKNTGGQIDRLLGMGVIESTGKGGKWSPFVYKLKSNIREIIEGTYEKRNDSRAA